MTNIDGRDLYRIGTGWVYDIKHDVGYCVRREHDDKQKRGKVVEFIKVFEMHKDRDGSYRSKNVSAVPAGVIRKAVKIVQERDQGNLTPRQKSYR